MKVLIFSEAPTVVSSLGKVVSYLASGLAELGYEVHIAPFSLSITSSLLSFEKTISLCELATKSRVPLADLYPCVDIHIHPWGRLYPVTDLDIVHEADALIVYSYPYVELDLNDIAYKFFTSRGKPAVVYALHEGPVLGPEEALSVVAYSVVVTPTRDTGMRYIDALAKSSKVDQESVGTYFAVLQHPVNAEMFNPRVVGELRKHYGEPLLNYDAVIGMIAKNHIRKDYAALLEAVVRVRIETGRDIAAGLYWIDAVSGNYWKRDDLVRRISGKLGVGRELVEESIEMLPQKYRAHGVPDSYIVYAYTSLMTMHLFLTRAEAYGLPPVESVLLGVPTATTDIPQQREIFGDEIRYVRTGLLERDDFTLYRPDPVDASKAITEYLEGKLPAPNREKLAEVHDYRNVAKKLSAILDVASKTPKPLSEKLGIPVVVRS
ncbi:MAG: hypothetical protein QXZ31_03675 [Thermofilaceae archaeon]